MILLAQGHICLLTGSFSRGFKPIPLATNDKTNDKIAPFQFPNFLHLSHPLFQPSFLKVIGTLCLHVFTSNLLINPPIWLFASSLDLLLASLTLRSLLPLMPTPDILIHICGFRCQKFIRPTFLSSSPTTLGVRVEDRLQELGVRHRDHEPERQ